MLLQRRTERHRHGRKVEPLRRLLEEAEALVGEDAGHLRRHAGGRITFVRDHQPSGLADRLADRVRIERRERPQVDDLGIDALDRELGRRLQAAHQIDRIADEGDVAALANDRGLAEGQRLAAIGRVFFLEQQCMVDPECRPLAVLGGRQQPLHVRSECGRDDLQSGCLHEHGLRTSGVLRGTGYADSDQRMEHDRDFDLAAAHVGDIGRLVDDLRPGFECKAAGADGDDRVETRHCRADAHPAKAELGDRCAQDARLELVVQRLDAAWRGANRRSLRRR